MTIARPAGPRNLPLEIQRRAAEPEAQWVGDELRCWCSQDRGGCGDDATAREQPEGFWRITCDAGCPDLVIPPDAGAAPHLNGGPPERWLESAADLLAEPDPGPTPFAIEGLLVDQAIAAIQGTAKAGKTWLILELVIALVTGREALGEFAVAEAGPVVLVLEESGRAALHRRLAKLIRAHRLDPAALRHLHFSANRRVVLTDPAWQARLTSACASIRPRAVFLDPLVRMKGSGVDEDSQREMGPVLDFMRELRESSGGAVAFAHHTPHDGRRMRGSSDLEAYWESKLVLDRKSDGLVDLTSEHREAEAGPSLTYRRAYEPHSDSLRLEIVGGRAELVALVREYVAENPGVTSKDAVASGIAKRAEDVRTAIDAEVEGGRLLHFPSRAPDAFGRTGYYVPADVGLTAGTGLDGERAAAVGLQAADRPGEGPPHRGAPRDGGPQPDERSAS